MEREKLEKAASELGLQFTAETSDESLGLMIQLAESKAQNTELAEALAKAETQKKLGTTLPVIKSGKKLYQATCPQFNYSPKKFKPSKRGAGGIISRTIESAGDERTVKTEDLEKPENKEVLEWLLESGSSILEEITETEGGK